MHGETHNNGEQPTSLGTDITLPTISHLQFLYLALILEAGGQPVAGTHLRQRLSEVGHGPNRAAFSNIICRLANSGLIEVRTLSPARKSQIPPKAYQVSDFGKEACKRTLRFYAIFEEIRNQIGSALDKDDVHA